MYQPNFIPNDTYLLLRDDFRIGLVISPRVAVLAWWVFIKLIYLLINP
jgi:hypothetical protein